VIENCFNTGIWLIEDGSSRITGNHVSGCSGEGINLEDSRACIVEGNDCRNIKGPGIYLRWTMDTMVSHCNLFWNEGADYYYDGLWLRDSGNNTVHNNTFTGLPDVSILMDNSSGNHIRDNWMEGNSGAGIVARKNSNENLFTFNVVKDCEGGIYLYEESIENVVHHNDIINISGTDGYDTTRNNQWWDGVGEGNHWSNHLTEYPDATTSDHVTWSNYHAIDSSSSNYAKDPHPLIFPFNLGDEGFIDATSDRGFESGAEIMFRCMIEDSEGMDDPKVIIGSGNGNLSEVSNDLVIDDDGFWSSLFEIPSDFAGWLTYSFIYARDANDIVQGPFEILVVDDEDPIADAGDNIVVDAGYPFTLNGSRSSDNVGIVRYVWDLGYGLPDLEGEVVEYVIYDELSREISLTVFDEEGNLDTNRIYLKVLWEWFDVTVGPVMDAETGELLDEARVEMWVDYSDEEEWTDRNGICYFSLPHDFKGKTVNASVYRDGYNSLTLRFNISWEGEVDIGELKLEPIKEEGYRLEEDNGAGPVFAMVLFLVLLMLFIAIIVFSVRTIPREIPDAPIDGTSSERAT
jgi:parallel beta-helix repeat protein